MGFFFPLPCVPQPRLRDVRRHIFLDMTALFHSRSSRVAIAMRFLTLLVLIFGASVATTKAVDLRPTQPQDLTVPGANPHPTAIEKATTPHGAADAHDEHEQHGQLTQAGEPQVGVGRGAHGAVPPWHGSSHAHRRARSVRDDASGCFVPPVGP